MSNLATLCQPSLQKLHLDSTNSRLVTTWGCDLWSHLSTF